MSEQRANPGPEQGHKSDLDSVEEALIGAHQDEPQADPEDDRDERDHDARPDVPGHKSP